MIENDIRYFFLQVPTSLERSGRARPRTLIFRYRIPEAWPVPSAVTDRHRPLSGRPSHLGRPFSRCNLVKITNAPPPPRRSGCLRPPPARPAFCPTDPVLSAPPSPPPLPRPRGWSMKPLVCLSLKVSDFVEYDVIQGENCTGY